MRRASHNPSRGAGPTEALAEQLGRLPAARDDENSQISSAGQEREECEPGNSRSSRAFNGECSELVHELANTTTAVLMNAQLLGWRLPPYSHLKRPLREIERNAQRGAALMKCLLHRLGTEGTEQANGPRRWMQQGELRSVDSVTAQGPRVDSGSAENPPPPAKAPPAPVFFSTPEAELTSSCDACTSVFPKKG
jgi:hypothetical protein